MHRAPEPTLRYAGFGRRVAAFVVDMVLVYAVLFVAGAVWITQSLKGRPQLDIVILLLYPAVFVLGWLYWAGLESSGWQGTLGKRAFGLVVTDLAGRRISFGRATGRYFGKTLSCLVLYLGFLMAALTAKKQALHDLLAGTLVVQGLPPASPQPIAPQPISNEPFYR
jgi:uncharacterized RDD family membrane protein YckC